MRVLLTGIRPNSKIRCYDVDFALPQCVCSYWKKTRKFCSHLWAVCWFVRNGDPQLAGEDDDRLSQNQKTAIKIQLQNAVEECRSQHPLPSRGGRYTDKDVNGFLDLLPETQGVDFEDEDDIGDRQPPNALELSTQTTMTPINSADDTVDLSLRAEVDVAGHKSMRINLNADAWNEESLIEEPVHVKGKLRRFLSPQGMKI
jgi:hypothetical protein